MNSLVRAHRVLIVASNSYMVITKPYTLSLVRMKVNGSLLIGGLRLATKLHGYEGSKLEFETHYLISQ